MALLEIEHVSKVYRGGVLANDDISLKVEAGEVFGLLGPNGAGKTTLVNQIIGLLAPTSGTIRVAGVDTIQNPGFARQACSFQPQTQVPIDGMTPYQAIELSGRLRGGRADQVRARTQELIESFELGAWSHKNGEALSGGVRRLVAFCMAAVVPGQITILDEPTNDVDPLRRRLLWQQVRLLADRGSAVLLVTHNVLEAERSVDRLAIIDRGKVVGSGTPGSMKNGDGDYLRLELLLEPGSTLPSLPAFLSHTVNGGRRLIGRVSAADVTQATLWANQMKTDQLVEEYSLGPATLEDAYIRKIGRADALEKI
ncbi:MAG: ABC transporter ATP-binding protein [Anaerolineales bacterium]|jgi:ABC-2 type transport system ATP-binding protein